MEKKKSVFAKHPKITMTVFVTLVILIIAGGIFWIGTKLLNNNDETTKENVESIITSYLEAYGNYNTNKLLEEIVDTKGGAAWEECGGDATAFLAVYESISDEDIETYENELSTEVEKNKYFFETYLDSHTIKLVSVDSYEELEVEGLIEAKTTVEEKWSYGETSSDEDDSNPSTKTIYFYIYNGKIIGKEEVDDTNIIDTTGTEDVENTSEETTTENTTNEVSIENVDEENKVEE